jgi:hypothetical protein
MGWWSEDIMGGDDPLDIQYLIYTALGLEEHDEEVEIPAHKFDYDKIIAFTSKDDDYWLTGDTGNIFHQVLGVMMMRSGAVIDDALKAKFIEAAEKDEWANGTDGYEDESDVKRQKKMQQFIATLKEYNNIPTDINSVSLMDKIVVDISVNSENISVETLRSLLLVHVKEYKHEEVNKILDKIIEIS